MNKQLKNGLKQIYEAPAPMQRQEFLRRFPAPQISTPEFLRMQSGYIRKENWVIAVIVFGISVYGSCFADRSMIWVLSAVIPFLALAATAEFGRSARWGMQELEMASRFSLKLVLAARMGILGTGNLILLAGISPLAWKWQQTTLVNLGFSILLPYLLTTFLNLEIIRRIHGKENLYACMAAAAFVSLIFIVNGNTGNRIFMYAGGHVWMGILALLALLTGKEIILLLKQTEEYVWS